MRISVSEARRQLYDLVRRAEIGEEVILTRHGHPIAQLTPITTRLNPADRRAVLEAVRAAGSAKATKGPTAAASQDFLYARDDG